MFKECLQLCHAKLTMTPSTYLINIFFKNDASQEKNLFLILWLGKGDREEIC